MSLERETRKVFDSIHRAQIARPASKERLRSLITTGFLGVDDDFFHDKSCADIGCGSGVHGTINLLRLGARHVSACDLDDSIVEPATRELEPTYAGRYSLHTGSVLELPFADGEFDFFLCDGVLHHLNDQEKAIGELFRILRPGGSGSIMVAGNHGLMHRFVFECVRDEYHENEELARFVDDDPAAAVAWLSEQIAFLKREVGLHGSTNEDAAVRFLDALAELIDEELILTIKDRLQSPVNRGLSDRLMTSLFAAAGFSSWRRLARRVPFGNVRKILGPLYYHQDHPLSRMLYGDGSRLHYLVTR